MGQPAVGHSIITCSLQYFALTNSIIIVNGLLNLYPSFLVTGIKKSDNTTCMLYAILKVYKLGLRILQRKTTQKACQSVDFVDICPLFHVALPFHCRTNPHCVLFRNGRSRFISNSFLFTSSPFEVLAGEQSQCIHTRHLIFIFFMYLTYWLRLRAFYNLIWSEEDDDDHVDDEMNLSHFRFSLLAQKPRK